MVRCCGALTWAAWVRHGPGRRRSTAWTRALFGQGKPTDPASLVVAANSVTELRLPAALFREREFVVEGRLDAADGDRVMQFQVLTAPPPANTIWDGKSPLVAAAGSDAFKRLLHGFAEFRRFSRSSSAIRRIVPEDEVVCLKLYHREDEPLARLFLDENQQRRLNRLWEEHRFISTVADHRAQEPAALHRLRDPGPAEGPCGLL